MIHPIGVPRPSTQALKVRLTRFPGLYARARLPYGIARYLMRRPHDYDYAAFALFPQSDGLFLDVGANAGMSAMSLRIYQRRARILALEPNPYHEADLRWTRRVVGRMDYEICAAGLESGEAQLFVPIYREVPITAEASMSRRFVEQSPSLHNQLGERINSPAFRIAQTRVPVRRLDDLGLAPAFVKVDVQGFEQPVLAGMTETLREHLPPVLVEAPDPETVEFMVGLGYRPYVYEHPARTLVLLNGQEVTNVMFVAPGGATPN